jgi:putative intracellular protease/amidase
MKKIAIAIWDGVEELDFAGPYEVLTSWGAEVKTVAETRDPLHLVARLDSVEAARNVRRYIQYDPEPPV